MVATPYFNRQIDPAVRVYILLYVCICVYKHICSCMGEYVYMYMHTCIIVYSYMCINVRVRCCYLCQHMKFRYIINFDSCTHVYLYRMNMRRCMNIEI